MSTSCFQKILFFTIGSEYYDESSENNHSFFSHIVVDQVPYDRISDRTGYSSSYILNGLGLLCFSLLGWLLDYTF
jgi:hypothetical protein